MRTRKQIEIDFGKNIETLEGMTACATSLSLEVLLDIRAELIKANKTEITGKDSK